MLQLSKNSMKLKTSQRKAHGWPQWHPTVQLPKYMGRTLKNNRAEKLNAKITNMEKNEGTVDQQIWC